MLEENKKRNAHRKVIPSPLNEDKNSKIPSYTKGLDNRRTSFNKPRPPRPIHTVVPCINPINQDATVKRRQKVKEASIITNDKTSKPSVFVKDIKLNSITDQLNNNLKELSLEPKCNVGLTDSPQVEDMPKIHEIHVPTAKANKSISDISGFKLVNVPKVMSKERLINSAMKEAYSANKENNLVHKSKCPPNTAVPDIPALSNRINEKLRQIAMERNRNIQQPSLATPDQILVMSPLQTTTTLSDSIPHLSQNNHIDERLSKHIGDDVTDETLNRLSKKYFSFSPYQCSVGCNHKDGSIPTSPNLDSPIKAPPSKLPLLTLDDTTRKVRKIEYRKPLKVREDGFRMKYLMNGEVSNLTPVYERSGSEAENSDKEIPVIEQLLIQKKKTGKVGRVLTRPDIVPVDQKAKIYFLINHNQGTISHVIKSQAIKSN